MIAPTGWRGWFAIEVGSCGGRRLGLVIGESTPDRSTVIFSMDAARRVRAGSYLVGVSLEGCVLGIVERLVAGSLLYPGDMSNPLRAESVRASMGGRAEYYLRGSVRWLARVEDLARGRIMAPKHPVLPGTDVYSVSKDLLSTVFSPRAPGWARLGEVQPDGVEYRVNLNRLTRHLAILAVTGGGKSNTVCVLTRQLVSHGATVVLFDMHGEYGDLGLGRSVQEHDPASVNPAALDFSEVLRLVRMPANAINQERILRWAWKNAIKLYRASLIRSSEILDIVRGLVKDLAENNRETYNKLRESGGSLEAPPGGMKQDQAQGVLNKLDDLQDYYGDILNPKLPLELERVIRPGGLTVFNLSSLDEQGADAVVSHYLRRLLQERKRFKSQGKGYPSPVLAVVEEAHVLIPNGGDTLTKYWAARVAREGRKFGLGLALVSQRPRNVDPDVLSQTNNKIILKMVEPQDIRYVQAASEDLTEDLSSLLPSLNPGEAVVIGTMTRLPAVAKIDLCKGKKGGGDIPLIPEERGESGEDLLDQVF